MMTIYPAVDLQGGRQVGLVGGDLGRRRAYGDPLAFVRARVEEGFRALHVVDLDGAAAGHPVQVATLEAIRRAAPGLRIQVGGGVRSVADALCLRDAGADRVVVGTLAVRALLDPEAPAAAGRDLLGAFLAALGPEHLAVALDGAPGTVAVDAWRERRTADLVGLGRRLVALGVRHVVHTDTARDGSLGGVRTEAAACLAAVGLCVVAAGGVQGDGDIAALAAAGAAGVVVGRAFHAGAWRPTPAAAAAGVGA